MEKWDISKEFSMCYGHRVWSQELIEGYSEDMCLACRHLHGHQGTIIVHLSDNGLTNGMVTDFKHLGWFKKWLDNTLDHKFIMDINDPLLPYEVPFIYGPDGNINLSDGCLVKGNEDFWYIPESLLIGLDKPLQEKYEGMVFVDFVPTSENLSKWIYGVVQNKMKKINVNVDHIEFFETPKSRSTYHG